MPCSTRLFQPVESYLNEAQIVYVIPDRTLYYLPFESLVISNEAQSSSQNFLLTNYLIIYIQSASILKTVREDEKRKALSPKPQQPLLVFADPVYPDGQISGHRSMENIRTALQGRADNCANPRFDRIPYTATEARSLAEIYEVDQTGQAFNLQDKARESRVKNLVLSDYRYVHFATHGVLCDETEGSWVQSSLVLSLIGEPEEEEKRGNEGFLQMSEVFNLSLQADLVTLSACQTGLGKEIVGEGLVGLSRAFMYAGTTSIMVSLWNVNDASTAHFMEQFYQNLQDGMSKVEALREAKLDMLNWFYTDDTGKYREHSHPYYWAPFILIGEWQ